MHKLWNNAKEFQVLYDNAVSVEINNLYRLYVWAGKNMCCEPKEHLKIDSYISYELFIHKIIPNDVVDPDKVYREYEGIFTRLLNYQEYYDLKLDKYLSNYGEMVYDNLYKLIYIPKNNVEEIYDILSGNNNSISYGGNCKICKLFDNYATPDNNGDYYCYKHFYK